VVATSRCLPSGDHSAETEGSLMVPICLHVPDAFLSKNRMSPDMGRGSGGATQGWSTTVGVLSVGSKEDMERKAQEAEYADLQLASPGLLSQKSSMHRLSC
jgi:hypothetical protein